MKKLKQKKEKIAITHVNLEEEKPKQEPEISEEEKQKISKNHEKQMKIAAIIMISAIALIFLFYWISIESKKFTYSGIEFTKGKEGNTVLYLGIFPVKDIYGKVVSTLRVYFRSDPRDLEIIPITGKLQLQQNVAIAIDKQFAENCEYGIVAPTTLGVFLSKLNIKVYTATTNKTEAELYKRYYVECNDTSMYSVVNYINGTQDRITRVGNTGCYIIESKDCNLLNVTERFMIGLYQDNS